MLERRDGFLSIFRGFLQRNPGSSEAKDVWMLNLSNFARKKLIQLNKIGRTKIETLFLCQDPRAYI